MGVGAGLYTCTMSSWKSSRSLAHLLTSSCFLSGRQHIGAHALCMQHSSTAAALSTSFLLDHVPQQPELNTLTTRFRESHSSVSMIRESKRLKNQGATGWILAMHWYSICVKKMRFSCFPVLPGSTKAHVIIWGGIVNFFWLLTLWITFLPKNIKMCSCQS